MVWRSAGVALISVLAAQSTTTQQQPANAATNAQDRTGHARLLRVWEGRIPAAILRSPLFHDEQQIQIGDWNGPDIFGAMIDVAAVGDLQQIKDPSFDDTWVALVMLHTDEQDEATKDSGIPQGYSCYYVRKNTAEQDEEKAWEALVVTRPVDLPCNPSQNSNMRPNAEMERFDGRSDADYPGAVRLELDDKPFYQKHTRIYAGARCGAGWCTISLTGDKPKVPKLKGSTKQDLVPGWHDEQRLAYNSKGKRIATSFRVKLVPNDNLMTNPIPADYIEVARIITDGSVNMRARDTYRAKWGLSNWDGESISISVKSTGLKQYRVRYATDSDTAEFDVEEFGHSKAPSARPTILGPLEVPGTARWGELSDGTVWIRCDDGCCTVS